MILPDHNPTRRGKKRPIEISLTAIVLGVLLSLVMGAANVYLGLKAGMTVSASIPAAVIAMGVLRGILRRSSIQESNLVQTAASAGESLAAGIIFTMPALVLIGVWNQFDYWVTSLIALAGGLLGVLLMIPMRRVFIVDNTELKYPEGVACAEVLKAGSGPTSRGASPQSTGVRAVVIGIAAGALFKFAGSFVGLLQGVVQAATRQGTRVFYFGIEVSPALIAVGLIVGLPISIQVFLGDAIGWLIAMPMMQTDPADGATALQAAETLWADKVRYIGVGAMVVGGIASIWRVREGLVAATSELFALIRGKTSAHAKGESTQQNVSSWVILTVGGLCVLLIGGLYYTLLQRSIELTVVTTLIMVVMSFFFAAVASYIVGLVGNSNSPVSGMTITAVLATGALILMMGFGGEAGMIATLGVAGVVCCVACTSGDVCNDLKTGQLVGASPRSQQVMQLVGVTVAAFVMAPVMTVLHQGSLNDGTGGIGGRELSAPQASLFAALANGFFGEQPLPKQMVVWGVVVGLILLLLGKLLEQLKVPFRLHVMPVAVGIYLPFGLASAMLLGGILSVVIRRRAGKDSDASNKQGVLVASGLIAGESLVGVLLGVLAYMGIGSLKLSEATGGSWLFDLLSILALAAVMWLIVRLALAARKPKTKRPW